MNSLAARNPALARLMRSEYSEEHVREIRLLLTEHGTLDFPTLPNGLFSAASVSGRAEHTGYQAVWVRDTVHIAHALAVTGETEKARCAILALTDHFERQRQRFEAIITQPELAAEPSNRPHVKFNGWPSAEIAHWSHDQNDALGYFLWLASRLARLGALELSARHEAVLARFPDYFEAIRFWEDDDSGHWEEARKNSASSIGAVCAGLRELRCLLESGCQRKLAALVSPPQVEGLLEAGRKRLTEILPAECIQPPPRRRLYDAALLFLIYPLEIVADDMADQILARVHAHLEGPYGIRRYLGDSFWCADYRKKVPPEERTRDYSSDIEQRNQLMEPGTEAQWCVFDPIVSVIYGRRYAGSGDSQWLRRQVSHFNRALSQLTADLRCAELWHLETAPDGSQQLETSEATPLLWTQANLLLALGEMSRNSANSGH